MNAHVSPPVALSQDWDALDQGKFADETATVRGLLANMPLDGTERAAVLQQAESLVLDAAAVVPIYFNTHVYLLHPAVKGWQPTPMDHTDYRYVSIKP